MRARKARDLADSKSANYMTSVFLVQPQYSYGSILFQPQISYNIFIYSIRKYLKQINYLSLR